jgi:hypothetical protein
MIRGVPAGVRPSDAVYTPVQRAAIALAYERQTRGKVAELARSGKLRGFDGRVLPPFDLPPTSVATIARRVWRAGVAGDDGGLDPATTRRLYDKLGRRARRLAEGAQTAEDVREAARALEVVERLRPRVEKLPAPSGPSTLGRSILDSHRGAPGGGVYTRADPEPEPVRAPEREPEPAPPRPTPGEWVRAQVAALAPATPAPRSLVRTGAGSGNETRQTSAATAANWPDKPLPSAEPRRGRRIGGGPSYAYPGG